MLLDVALDHAELKRELDHARDHTERVSPFEHGPVDDDDAVRLGDVFRKERASTRQNTGKRLVEELVGKPGPLCVDGGPDAFVHSRPLHEHEMESAREIVEL